MTVQQVEQMYHGLQIVPCKVTSVAGETGMYIFLFPSVEYTPAQIKDILERAIRDFVGEHSYHKFVSPYNDDNSIAIIIEDINRLIPPRMVQ